MFDAGERLHFKYESVSKRCADLAKAQVNATIAKI